MTAACYLAPSRPRTPRLIGATLVVLAGLAGPAAAQSTLDPAGAATAQPAYQLFRSHVEWRAQAVAENNAKQASATWTALPSRIARSNGNWQPMLLPGEAAKRPPRPAQAGADGIDLRR